MLSILKNFFGKNGLDNNNNLNLNSNLELLCGLMIEAANSDGNIDDKEITKIKTLLIEIFKENKDDVEKNIKYALENRNNSKSLYYYTSRINKIYSEEKKVILLETLWEIIYSDGQVHDYETSLIRRLSGLLYISDVKSGNARKKALHNRSRDN